jgi:hypothetical protein
MPVLPIFHLLAILVLLHRPVVQVKVELAPESRIWIEGRSNLGPFTCHATEKNGYAFLAAPAEGTATAAESDAKLEVRIPVGCMECGNDRMDRDMFNALKGAEHPDIHFELIDASANQIEGRTLTYRIDGAGRLTVAGTSRQIPFTADAIMLANDHMRATGAVVIHMSDLNIDPPTAVLGLVRAHDQLTVNFDLIARPVQ